MKILIVHEYFLSPHSRVGSGSRWNQMAKYWTQAGHHVTVLAGSSDGVGNKIDAYKGTFVFHEKDSSGAEVYRCHVSESYNRSFAGRLWAYFSFVFSGLWAGMRSGRQDVIVASSPPLFVGIIGVLLSWMKRCPFVFEVRDLWPESAIDTGVLRNPLSIRLGLILERWIYKNSACINALTPAFVERLRDVKNIPPSQLSMIPNACDFDLIPQLDNRHIVRQKLGLANEVLVTYVGAHGVANHLDQILEAAKQLKRRKDIRFMLIGDGMTKPMLRKKAREWELDNLVFHDPVPKSEIFDYLRASDICIAVLKKVDTFKTVYPNKVFDYMSVSKPVIVGIDGQARKLVEESGCGYYAEPENANEIAEAVEKLATAPKLRERMGKAGRAHVEKHFDRRKLAEKYEGILSRLVGKRPLTEGGKAKPEPISFSIGLVETHEWNECSRLIASAIPNAIISHLGTAFGAKFYSRIAADEQSCAYVARDDSGRVLGVIIGSLDKPKAYSDSMASQRITLALAANVRLAAPSTLAWILKGLVGRRRGDENIYDRPKAELIKIVLHPEARGMGVGRKLIGAMEAFLQQKGLNGPYTILTEAANAGANQFYAKIGAKLVRQYWYHGRLMNEWNKSVAAD